MNSLESTINQGPLENDGIFLFIILNHLETTLINSKSTNITTGVNPKSTNITTTANPKSSNITIAANQNSTNVINIVNQKSTNIDGNICII